MPDTLSNIVDSFRRGESDPVDLAQRHLAAARYPEGEGERVFIELDDDKVLRQAKASARRMSGRGIGSVLPLDGVTISVKDNFDVASERTAAGGLALSSRPAAAEDAVAVARLRAAGAVLVGRTNMVEFAYSVLGLNEHHGTPRNRWQRNEGAGLIPGGSSSGAGVCVADGMSTAALGTDTGGSIRVPAALNGLAGFKPTARRVPLEGVVPLSVSLDSVGTIANSIDCCTLLDGVLSGSLSTAARPAARTVRGMRFVVPSGVLWSDLDPAVESAARGALDALARAGAVVDVVEAPELDAFLDGSWQHQLLGGEITAWYRSEIGEELRVYDAFVRRRFERSRKISSRDYFASLFFRRKWIEALERKFHPYDAILTPTVACIAPPIDAVTVSNEAFDHWNARILRNVGWVNYLDACAATVPCHDPGSAPVGLQLVGLHGMDYRILVCARACEEELRRVSEGG